MFTRIDVFPENLDELVPVWSALLVPEAKGVHHLMKNGRLTHATHSQADRL